LLSDFQISVPEMGTIKARHIPHVVLTSNRTRELSEALRRRCLYHWIDYPDFEKEMKIVHARLPEVGKELSGQVVRFVRAVRHLDLSKPPGVAETLDCTRAVGALGKRELDVQAVEDTISCVVKTLDDGEKLKAAGIDRVLTEAL
jgi:MoxR-like ATPase